MTPLESLRKVCDEATDTSSPHKHYHALIAYEMTFNPALVKLMIEALEQADLIPGYYGNQFKEKMHAIREHLEGKAP